MKKFKYSVNKFELDYYIEKVVDQLYNSLPTFSRHYSVVFVGDISFNFEIFKLFFKAYRAKMPDQTTFIVLGNHKL